MDTFRWMPVIVLAALGLGAVRLLAGAARGLRTGHGAADRPALAWGAAILLQLAAFGWGFWAAAGIATAWTPLALGLLALFVALLVAAAVLVLPLRRAPEAGPAPRFRDALGALAAFHAAALVTNGEVWREGVLTESARISVALLAVMVAGLLGARSRVALAAACGYIAIVGWAMIETWRGGF